MQIPLPDTLGLLNGPSVLDVNQIRTRSHEVSFGDLFIAIQGHSSDGHDFIEEAFDRGAAWVMGEKNDSHPRYLKVNCSRSCLAELASLYFGVPSRDLCVIGVTGTSGKTTTTYLLESILQELGRTVGVLGTVNFRYGGKVFPASHTTPDPLEIQRRFSEMKNEGCDTVVMEVSSHALRQKRVFGVGFDVGVFTNLSPEHLDYHKDMEDYFAAKKILFSECFDRSRAFGKNPKKVINLDDEYGRRLKDSESLSFSCENPISDVFPSEIRMDSQGTRFSIDGVDFFTPLIGRFNLENVLAAIASVRALGFSYSEIRRGVSKLQNVPGRLERVSHYPKVFVDYAHKPAALEKVLRVLQPYRSEGRLMTVFGCGGDRDRSKRSKMGEIAQMFSDHVFVTSDNPRTENPHQIIEEILKGIKNCETVTVEPDRKKAISNAVQKAAPQDVVLIAGKGHEDYQIIAAPNKPGGTTKIHFDDREISRAVIAELKSMT